MYLEKAMLTSTNNQQGALFCNAVDDNLYDSTQWGSRMPSNSIHFHTNEHGSTVTTYTSYFACYDGWDSDSQTQTHDSLNSAINSAWRVVYQPQQQGNHETTNHI